MVAIKEAVELVKEQCPLLSLLGSIEDSYYYCIQGIVTNSKPGDYDRLREICVNKKTGEIKPDCLRRQYLLKTANKRSINSL